MDEIRSICTGLVLPQIETASLPDVLRRAVSAHCQRTGAAVELSLNGSAHQLSPSAKISMYRFVQEALNNGFRHANGQGQTVYQTFEDGSIVIEVGDKGPGFDPSALRPGGLGLAGLRERIESLGGTFDISTSDKGTVLRMSLKLNEMENV
jgi:signal transduction histidine kinase